MANIESREIRYSAAGVEMIGTLFWDSSIEGARPGVIVVHEWWGANDYPKKRAAMLAELGYAGCAVDLYGAGRVAANPGEAGELMDALLGDTEEMRARFNAALSALRADEITDAAKTAAIGYCMGGGIVLHMARHGADLAAVASFHGALPLAIAAAGEGGDVQARVAVYHGEADEFITMADAAAFSKEMERAGADLLFVLLPGCTHGFTNPLATERGKKYGLPLRYSERADCASWDHLQLVLESAFA
jgi:dienelactone hydrolase